ncbi:hypothetical protein Ciccas_002801 [Cichlidogyrus casuarinus]|uniref:SCP domain-containing protein n=1 Tax=Cichlidogyrus casuarinus TaxID=1844966 RepID=A0ABD2QGJ8_9PLAT
MSLRSLHGCPDLKLNHELAKDCQKYAEELAKKGKMQHSDGDYGENLAYREHSQQAYHSGKLASNHWYSEIKDYNFDGDEQLNCGHFSQLIWKDCKEAGFGVALSADKKKVFVVGRYLPPGNWRGQWKENIPRPVSGEIYIPTDADIGN